MKYAVLLLAGVLVISGCATARPPAASQPAAQRLIFDTDIGNDIDDALALGVIHSLQSRGECKLLAVTITKDNRWCGPFVDAVNTFYGHGAIPIGVVHNGKTPEDSKYLVEIAKRFPHDITENSQLPDAVELLRKTLAAQPDHSVTIVQVGFSTNLARLIADDAGHALVKQKVALLSMMAGNFTAKPHKEYNIFMDAPSARELLRDWPTPIVLSGAEIGESIKYPATSIEHDFNYVSRHPLREAYELYQKMPYDRPTWDLTSVLYAVRPGEGYFDLSPPGEVGVDAYDVTHLRPSVNGRRRYLIASPEQRERVRQALIELASQPPAAMER